MSPNAVTNPRIGADAPRAKQFFRRVTRRACSSGSPGGCRRVMPDHLTALGVLAALGIAGPTCSRTATRPGCGPASARSSRLHWLGDSLDGTLARVRKIERPGYGYYLDHLVDALARR